MAVNSSAFAGGELLDPVAAYDRVAPVYACLAKQRGAYLDAIDRIVVSEIPPGSRSLLDIGAGDGARAGRIAGAAGLRDLILLEPSGVMRSHCPALANIWDMRAEDLHCRQGSFDVITCLWNVLGHILPVAARVAVIARSSLCRSGKLGKTAGQGRSRSPTSKSLLTTQGSAWNSRNAMIDGLRRPGHPYKPTDQQFNADAGG